MTATTEQPPPAGQVPVKRYSNWIWVAVSVLTGVVLPLAALFIPWGATLGAVIFRNSLALALPPLLIPVIYIVTAILHRSRQKTGPKTPRIWVIVVFSIVHLILLCFYAVLLFFVLNMMGNIYGD